MDKWNICGLLLWLFMIMLIYFLIRGIRKRRAKLNLIKADQGVKRLFIFRDVIDYAIIVLLVVSIGRFTFFTPPSINDHANLSINYSFTPLIIQPDKPSYYVLVEESTGRQPIQYYTYWTEGVKHQTNRWNATISDGKDPINVAAKIYNWPKSKIKNYEETTEKSFVATMNATYKSNFWNGLKLKAGRPALRFDLIRIPDSSFIKVTEIK